jgi:hypothetical protein
MQGPELNADILRRLLDAVGAHLEARGVTESVVVVGGAALCLRGWVERTTADVDVIAMVTRRADAGRADGGDTGGDVGDDSDDSPKGEWRPPEIGAELADATQRVARDFGVDADWFNTLIGSQWRTGQPAALREDVMWIRFRGLHVGLAGRQALITLKLFAALDQGPRSVRMQDLLVLSPGQEELERASQWVLEQDASEAAPTMLAQVIEHVRGRR